MFSILRQNCKLVKPTGRAHLKKGGRLPKLPLKPGSIPPPPNCIPNSRVWKFPTKRAQWPRARLTKPRDGAGPEEPPRGRGGNAEHRHRYRYRYRSGVALPMFPSMEIFLMRVPSELAEGEGQNLLGGVAMPGSRRLGLGMQEHGYAGSSGLKRHARAGGTSTLTLARGGAGGWAGPRSGHAPAAPTPTLHASPSPARDAGTVAPPGQPGAPGRRGQGRALRCELVGGQGRGLRDELIRRQGVGLNSVSPSPRVRLGGLNSAGKKSRK